MKLLVLHGPNLNLLGEREGEVGGRLEDLDRALREKAGELGVELKVVQSNHEGVLVDALHAERKGLGGVVVNPMGLFGSHVLKEALELVDAPAIEVSLGALREGSVVAEACAARVGGRGRGFGAYLEALERLASGDVEDEVEEEAEASEEEEAPVRKSLGRRAAGRKQEAPALALARTVETVKTLGRKNEAAAVASEEKPGKTLGRAARGATPATDLLTRAMVRAKIADRLAGKLSAAELATWARTQWHEVQRGAPAESGHRDMLEESLQSLTLSTLPTSRLTDEQLVDWMTRLDG